MNDVKSLKSTIRSKQPTSFEDLLIEYSKCRGSFISEKHLQIIKGILDNSDDIVCDTEGNYSVIEEMQPAFIGELQEDINEFKKNYDKTKEYKVDKLVEKFVKKYPVEKINKLDMDSFIYKAKKVLNEDTFCTSISFGLTELASAKNCRSSFFEIYKNEQNKIMISDTYKKINDGNLPLTFEVLKQEVVKIIKAIEDNNDNEIISANLNAYFKNRLMITYGKEKYIPVASSIKMDNYCAVYGMDVKGLNIIEKQNKLKNVMRKNEFDGFSNYMFMCFTDLAEKKNIIYDTGEI